MGIPEEKTFMIANGVDTIKFYPTPRDEARHRLDLQCSKLILSVGNLTPNKGFDLLIRALAVVAARLGEDNLQLAVVGERRCRGEHAAKIVRQRLGGRVHLIGAVPHEKLHL